MKNWILSRVTTGKCGALFDHTTRCSCYRLGAKAFVGKNMWATEAAAILTIDNKSDEQFIDIMSVRKRKQILILAPCAPTS